MDLQQIIEELEHLRGDMEQLCVLALGGADPAGQSDTVLRDLERLKQITKDLENTKR